MTTAHPPMIAGVGTDFVIAEVTAEGLREAAPDTAAMRAAAQRFPARLAAVRRCIFMSRDGQTLQTRMFAPLSGITEDPATGSANVALAALLLSLGETQEHRADHPSGRGDGPAEPAACRGAAGAGRGARLDRRRRRAGEPGHDHRLRPGSRLRVAFGHDFVNFIFTRQGLAPVTRGGHAECRADKFALVSWRRCWTGCAPGRTCC